MQSIGALLDLSKLNPLNLVYNSSFEYHTLGSAGVPDLWDLEGTPTLAIDTGDIGYGAVSQKITATGANLEGITYALIGLKALTKYSVRVRTKVTAGGDASQMLTTGAGVNMAATESVSATWETIKGSFTTDNAGTTVVLKLMAKVATDIVWFDGVEVNEGDGVSFHNKPILQADARFVDRGDPATYDYAEATFTKDGAWYDYDLSAIVPAGAKAVVLAVGLKSAVISGSTYIQFRKNGNANNLNSFLCYNITVSNYATWDGVVACDVSRIIEIAVGNSVFAAIDVIIKGWIF